jgi:hypothetical protein
MAYLDKQSERQLDWDTLASKRPLPIQFSLYASQRVSKALCPALVVRVDGVEVVRILDPEHKEPFFSLEGIFVLAGLTIVEGLLRFDLRRDRNDYDLTLAGLEPREGIWAPWKVARDVVERLGMQHLFASLLHCQHAWSLDEGLDGVSHNWRGTSDGFDADAYSLVSLLDMPLKSLQILPRGQQLRTLLSPEQRQKILADGKPAFLLLGKDSERRQRRWHVEQRLLRWSVHAVESFLEIKEELSLANSADSGPQDLQTDQHVKAGSYDDQFDIKGAEIVFLLNDMLPQTSNGASLAVGEGLEITTSETIAHSLGSSVDVNDSVRQARISLVLIHQFNRLYIDQAVAVARHHLAIDANQTSAASASIDEPLPDDRLSNLLSSNERIEASLDRLVRSQEVRSKRPASNSILKSSDSANLSWRSFVTIAVSAVLTNLVIQAFLSSS